MKLTKSAIIGLSTLTISTFVSSVQAPAFAQNFVQNGSFTPTNTNGESARVDNSTAPYSLEGSPA